MKNLGVIVSSTRPTRIGGKVAEWVTERVPTSEWNVKVLDLQALALPFLDEEETPRNGNYKQPHTLSWSKAVSDVDAVLIVTPEYNMSFPATIKNAIDMLYAEWVDKPIGLLGYGFHAALGATDGLAGVFGHIGADVRGTVNLTIGEDVEPDGRLASDKAAASVVELVSKLA